MAPRGKPTTAMGTHGEPASSSATRATWLEFTHTVAKPWRRASWATRVMSSGVASGLSRV